MQFNLSKASSKIFQSLINKKMLLVVAALFSVSAYAETCPDPTNEVLFVQGRFVTLSGWHTVVSGFPAPAANIIFKRAEAIQINGSNSLIQNALSLRSCAYSYVSDGNEVKFNLVRPVSSPVVDMNSNWSLVVPDSNPVQIYRCDSNQVSHCKFSIGENNQGTAKQISANPFSQ